ncbi:hypothetical protein [Cellulosimicrobium cellulans]|uniref:hypothetical protein n=1 Tax=Cellulosimicrobium cellulans TaxID=1710 RepID=UPI00130E5659|nr:hypothetical protein [Cellulosimicrobium cellulans]
MSMPIRTRAARVVGLCETRPTPGRTVAAEVAVRDVEAVEGAQVGAALRLRLARAVARVDPGTAARLYREHVEAAAGGPAPEPDDVLRLAEQGEWDVLGQWWGDDADRRAGALAALLDPAGGAPLRALVVLLDRLFADGVVPAPVQGPADAERLRALVEESLRSGDPAALGAASRAAEAVERRRGAAAGWLATVGVLAAGVATGAVGEDGRRTLAARLSRLEDGVPHLRALRGWWDVEPLIGPGTGAGSTRTRLASWTAAVARADAALDEPGPAAHRQEIRDALGAALAAAGGDTGLTRELRRCLVLEAARRGEVRLARAELGALTAAGAPDAARRRQRRALRRVVDALDTDWCVTRPRRLSPPAHAPRTPGDVHPVRVAERAAVLARLRQDDPGAFADAAGAFADELCGAGYENHRFLLSLRVAQAEVLLALGRVKHAARLARYADRQVRAQLAHDDDLRAASALVRIRAELASGSVEAARAAADALPPAGTRRLRSEFSGPALRALVGGTTGGDR